MDTYLEGTSLSSRAMSGFPLSVGTGIAMESVFAPRDPVYDPNRAVPNFVDLSKYTACWVNVTTLYRNMVSAVTKEGFSNASIEELASTIETEIDVINNLFEVEGRATCKPFFYYCEYKDLRNRNTLGLELREPTTDLQKYHHGRLLATLKRLEQASDTYHRFPNTIAPKDRESAFVLTHQPYDLTSFRSFERLDLLESNTGVLKPRSRWSSKYYPISGQSMDHLPFHRKLLLALGDKVLIKPSPLVLRKQIMETSLARHWTPATTEDKVKMDMELDIRDPYMTAVWRSY